MVHVIRVLALLALVLTAAPQARAVRAVILVRHAEKALEPKDDPALTASGERRAQALARLLSHQAVNAVFTTELQRTRLTAAPIARDKKLNVDVVKAGDTAGLLARIRALPANAVALVVGHSNTVPDIVKALGVREEIVIADDSYDRVFVVVPGAGPNVAPVLLELSTNTAESTSAP